MRARSFMAALALSLSLATAAHTQNATTQQAFADDVPLPILQSLSYVDIERGRALTLTDGQYLDEGRVLRLLSSMAQGDLDRDGTRDVAVLLEERVGSSSMLYLSAVVQRAGRVRNLASLRLGRDVEVRSVTISDQQIELRVLAMAAGDAPGRPSVPMLLAYKLSDNELLLMRREPQRRGSTSAPASASACPSRCSRTPCPTPSGAPWPTAAARRRFAWSTSMPRPFPA